MAKRVIVTLEISVISYNDAEDGDGIVDALHEYLEGAEGSDWSVEGTEYKDCVIEGEDDEEEDIEEDEEDLGEEDMDGDE